MERCHVNAYNLGLYGIAHLLQQLVRHGGGRVGGCRTSRVLS